MAQLWIRDVKLTISGSGGGITIQPNGRGDILRIKFKVEKTISGTPNKATIEIYNLSRANREKIKKEFDTATLEAGHVSAGNRGIIFTGHIRDVKHTRDGPDIITTVECGDGDKGNSTGVVSKNFPKGSKPADMVEELRKLMPEVDSGTVHQDIQSLPATKRPTIMCGACRSELNKLGFSYKFYWTIQDGALDVIPGNKFIDETTVISQQTGMIGAPSITDNGIEVKCLLNPAIKVGRVVEVRSEVLEMNGESGRFRVSGVGHAGDTHDDLYETEVSGERINGDTVDEGETGAEGGGT